MTVCIRFVRFVHGLWKALHDVRFSVLGMHALAKPRHQCECAKREGAHPFHGVIPCTRGRPHVAITFMEPFREREDARMSGYVALRLSLHPRSRPLPWLPSPPSAFFSLPHCAREKNVPLTARRCYNKIVPSEARTDFQTKTE